MRGGVVRKEGEEEEEEGEGKKSVLWEKRGKGRGM